MPWEIKKHFKEGGKSVCSIANRLGIDNVESTTNRSQVTCQACRRYLGFNKKKYAPRTAAPAKSRKPWKLSCLHCGHELADRYRFCPNCGHQFDNSKEGQIRMVAQKAIDELDVQIASRKKNGIHKAMRQVLRQIVAITEEPVSK